MKGLSWSAGGCLGLFMRIQSELERENYGAALVFAREGQAVAEKICKQIVDFGVGDK